MKHRKIDPQEQETASSGYSTPDEKSVQKQAKIKHLRKHAFVNRISFLDDMDKDSELNKNRLVGFYNMLYVVAFYYFIINPIMTYWKSGEWIETSLYNQMRRDLFMCIVTWPLFYAWSHIALLIQYLAMMNIPKVLIFIIQHVSQIFMFVYAQYLVLTRDWYLPQGAFVTFQSCVFFFKMHSYTMTNYKMRREWIDQGCPKSNDPFSYPNNINFKNFTKFIMTPVLVYEPQYPSSGKIRWWYVIVKFINTISMLIMGYMIVSNHIYPIILNVNALTLVDSIFQMTLPLIFLCLTLFNMIFENYCNFWAELTHFGDRQFYTDWWNSTDYEEFNRNWNRPVYEFLYRHVYLELIFEFGFGVKKAQLATFLFSAILHEYTLAVSLKQITPIMIMFMMIQIPVMLCTKRIKGTKFGNLFFWWGIIQGLPLILNLYLRFNELPKLLFE
ncbi:unnamed protein product (macronuclear) [Paramecium tetraurelia]|uniref:O-acyltransferase n=1 Tax=Paramecium tetraurelia TaxID=5888 RepID=A0E521_PARTE|nr:uncharacterized protein GSPATT00023565001 [Paramecium tetraurelia]CAK90388.1 unnamed protein product [Paramecium tetraurelia]|eukprot:XP_001457785.1 hypothetical protein (macronuclear) [Paramecium tetraurelia strain d4-2]